MNSKENCIFCSLSRNLPDSLIMETNYSYAIFDIKPITKGHSLVITKKHFENFSVTEDEYLKDVAVTAKKVAHYLKEKYPDIKGFNYTSNQGKEARQEIFHLHLHIIPRY